ncbi:MAG TPA: MarR family transcriptional regulator [Ramlibacter sp.]|nr:MarR family transcriptional regulator [Ramlibacter sp.]
MPGQRGSQASQKGRGEAQPERDLFDFQTDSLGYALRRAQMRAYELYYGKLSAFGLSPARMTALSLIAIEPDINQAALAQRLAITGPSVLKLVDSLEAAGLIERVAWAGDRRRYALALTSAGREKMEELRLQMASFEECVAAGLTAAERRQLMALLERVALPGNE